MPESLSMYDGYNIALAAAGVPEPFPALFAAVAKESDTVMQRLSALADRYVAERDCLPAEQVHAAIDTYAVFKQALGATVRFGERFNAFVCEGVSEGHPASKDHSVPSNVWASQICALSDFKRMGSLFSAIELPAEEFEAEKVALNAYAHALNELVAEVQNYCKVQFASPKQDKKPTMGTSLPGM